MLNGQEEASKTIALNIFIKIVGNTLAKSTFASIKYLIQNKKKWSNAKVMQRSIRKGCLIMTQFMCVCLCVCVSQGGELAHVGERVIRQEADLIVAQITTGNREVKGQNYF